ncbi:MAG: hypothetical protein ACI9W6_001180 [Motiliproteus sp.]
MFKRGRIGTLLAVLVVLSVQTLPSQAAVDPTRPPTLQGNGAVTPPVKISPWQLQLIRISAEGRQAVVNGVRLRQGDSVRGAQLVSIESGTVVLKKGNRRIPLQLGSSINIKRNSQGLE